MDRRASKTQLGGRFTNSTVQECRIEAKVLLVANRNLEKMR